MQMSAAALEGLEAAASDLEARIAADGADALGSDADAQALSVAVTGAKTRLVTARTQAEKAAAKAERAVAERRRRRRLLGEYQSLVLEMEHWTLEARGKADAAVKMSSLRAVRDDIHATEVIEKAFSLDLLSHTVDTLLACSDRVAFNVFCNVLPFLSIEVSG